MFRKEQVKDALDAANTIFKALSKPKQFEYLAEFNTLCLVLEKLQHEAK